MFNSFASWSYVIGGFREINANIAFRTLGNWLGASFVLLGTFSALSDNLSELLFYEFGFKNCDTVYGENSFAIPVFFQLSLPLRDTVIEHIDITEYLLKKRALPLCKRSTV